MKERIQITDYLAHILKALPRGILLNTQGDKFNSMVIGWGNLGVIWGVWTFVAYVRESRYTKAVLDATGEFSISVPLDAPIPLITRVCGAQSGYNVDKVVQAGLTLVEPNAIKTPGVKEYPLTLECRTLYTERQNLALLPETIRKQMYPENVDGTAVGANRDPHTAYIGQIVDAYIIK